MTSTPAPTSTPRRAVKMASNQSLNLNHLLNFTLPPRQSQPLSNLPRRSRRTGTQHGVWNKERFVNAQYRFVMNPSGDYTVHFADPDIFFQWNDIIQVIIPRSSALASAAAAGEQSSHDEGYITCPICLSPPAAPRMTKCGHIYCYPCILHYLSTSENKWATCPICFDSVNASQLKSVKWFDGPIHLEEESGAARNAASSSSSSSLVDVSFETAPRSGASMRMRLIQRPQITTLALPRSCTWPSDLLPPHQAPFHFLPDVLNYAKFMLATPSQLLSDLTRDLDELAVERRILAGMNDDLGISFIEGAEQKVHNQIAKASALDTPLLQDKIEKAQRDHFEIETKYALYVQQRNTEAARRPSVSDVPEEYLALRSTSSLPSPATAIPPSRPAGAANSKPNRNQNPRSTPRQRRNVNPPPPSTSTYYYYQAASGLPIYLHPLDIKILLSHFGDYASFPDDITIRVDAFSEGTVNDDLRKRCKYLAHMPESADVVFIEADLEGVVGVEGLRSFEGALRMRKGRRKDKGRKDDRAKARAEEREREKREYAAQASWDSVGVVLPSEPVTVEPEEAVVSSTPPVPPQSAAGVWGQSSFASALRSSASTRGSPRSRVPTQREEEDEWDLDIAWHELEQRSGGNGRKKRNNKLVVLGGGGGRRGR